MITSQTRRIGLLAFSFLLAVLVVHLLAPQGLSDRPRAPQVHHIRGLTMGTGYSVQLPHLPTSPDVNELSAQLQARLDRLDRSIFSTYSPHSEVSRFNRTVLGEVFPASAELLEVIALSKQVHHLSQGAFDITLGALVNLWGFGPARVAPQLPDPQQLAAARQSLGHQALQVVVEHGYLRRLQPVQLDLSAVAKGYAVDEIAAWLDTLGLQHYLVEIGGEVKIKGEKAPGQAWTLALEMPLDNERQVYRTLTLQGAGMAVASSGDYRNFFMLDGTRYSHELNPASGRPIEHNLASVTVLDPSAARADALATALLVLGPQAGLELAGRLELPACFILRQEGGFTFRQTEAFANYL